jgi:mono/diheme cytochrome c family protein
MLTLPMTQSKRMSACRRGFLKGAATAILAAAMLAGLAFSQSKSGNSQEGKRIFTTNGCYQCHGYAGQGGAAGARIGRTALSLAAFLRYVRAPTGNMPPYTAKVMTDEQLGDVYAYLQSLPAPTPRKDIPLLNEN